MTHYDSFRNENGFWAHDMPISWIDFHPTKHLIATSSDDRTWQMMNITEGEVLVSGKGHTDWLSCVKFSPNGEMVATSGGDRSGFFNFKKIHIWKVFKNFHIRKIFKISTFGRF